MGYPMRFRSLDTTRSLSPSGLELDIIEFDVDYIGYAAYVSISSIEVRLYPPAGGERGTRSLDSSNPAKWKEGEAQRCPGY